MKAREFFYTIEPKYKEVSKKELIEFIKNYPRKLEVSIIPINEPLFLTYNEFILNRQPYTFFIAYNDFELEYCIVAGYYYDDDNQLYQIRQMIDETIDYKIKDWRE